MLVRKIIPAIAVGRIILANSGPLAFREVRAPAFPVFGAVSVLLQPLRFGGRGERAGRGHLLIRFRGIHLASPSPSLADSSSFSSSRQLGVSAGMPTTFSINAKLVRSKY